MGHPSSSRSLQKFRGKVHSSGEESQTAEQRVRHRLSRDPAPWETIGDHDVCWFCVSGGLEKGQVQGKEYYSNPGAKGGFPLKLVHLWLRASLLMKTQGIIVFPGIVLN